MTYKNISLGSYLKMLAKVLPVFSFFAFFFVIVPVIFFTYPGKAKADCICQGPATCSESVVWSSTYNPDCTNGASTYTDSSYCPGTCTIYGSYYCYYPDLGYAYSGGSCTADGGTCAGSATYSCNTGSGGGTGGGSCSYADCNSCTAASGCGWCGDGSGGCSTGTASGPDASSCSNWAWTSNQCNSSGFSITVTPATASVAQSSTQAFTVTLTSSNSYTGTVTLSSSNCPSGVACSFAQTSLTVPANGTISTTFTTTAAATAPTGTYTINLNGTGGSATNSTSLQLSVIVPPKVTAVCDNTWRIVPGSGQTDSQPASVYLENWWNGRPGGDRRGAGSYYGGSVVVSVTGKDKRVYMQDCMFGNHGYNNPPTCDWEYGWQLTDTSPTTYPGSQTTQYSTGAFRGDAWDVWILAEDNHAYHNINWSYWTGWSDMGTVSYLGLPFRAVDANKATWQFRRNPDSSISYNCGPSPVCVDLPFTASRSSLSSASVKVGDTFTATCDYNSTVTSSITAVTGAGSCAQSGATGTTLNFTCTATNPGTFDVNCVTNTGTADNVCAASNKAGTITVQPKPLPNPDLKVTSWIYNNSDGPLMVYYGAPYALSWGAVSNATSCTLDGAAVAVAGGSINTYTATGFTNNTKTHTLTCTGPGGTASDSVVVSYPPPPTNATGSCNALGSQATLSWTPPAGYSHFYIRVDDTVDGYKGAADVFDQEDFIGSSYSFNTTPGHTYNWWMHTRDTAAGAWSQAPGGGFTCAVPKPAITITTGGPLNFYGFYGTASGNMTAPPAQNLSFSNTGNANLNWTASTNMSWCHVSKASGTVVPGGSDTISVSMDNPSVGGNFSCTITITDPNASNPNQFITANYGVTTCGGTRPNGDSLPGSAATRTAYVDNVANASFINFYTWSEINGQDDLWTNNNGVYSGTNIGGGTWTATADLSRHRAGNPDYGNFYVHVYAYGPGGVVGGFCGSANFVRNAPCDPNAVGSNQMLGCVYQGVNFDTLHSNAVSSSVVASPADNVTVFPYTDISGGINGVPNTFSIRWKGNFNFTGGNYYFNLGSDDGERIYVDGVLKYDDWNYQGYSAKTTPPINISAGNHTITYEYFQGMGGAAYNLSWTKALPPTSVDLKTTVWASWAGTGRDTAWAYNNSDGPAMVYDGAPYQLSWAAASNATSCTLDGVSVSVSGGSFNTYNAAGITTRTHTLTCTGPGGTASDSVTINVPPAPTNLAFTCSPLGTQMTINWTLPGGYTNAYFKMAEGVDNWVATVSDDNTTTSKTVAVSPGVTYHVWVDTKYNSNGAWGSPVSGNFSCAVVKPNQPENVNAINYSGDPSVSCGSVKISWTAPSSGPAPTFYKVYESLTGSPYSWQPIYTTPDATMTSYAYTPGSNPTAERWYAVVAYNGASFSDVAVANSGLSKTPTPCASSLSSSDKDITKVNNKTYQYDGVQLKQCNGTDTAPVVSNSFHGGDKLSFAINLCSRGPGGAGDVTVTDTLTSLVAPNSGPNGFNVRYNGAAMTRIADCTPAASIGLMQYSVCGSEPNQKITMKPTALIADGSNGKIELDAKIANGYPRFQNSAQTSYKFDGTSYTNTSFTTPLIPITTSNNSPSFEEN